MLTWNRYFNTVGSKEGWTPSAFVSSRTKRQKDATSNHQRPEDFMDDEDRADAEDARKVQTTDAFAGLGSTEGEKSSHATVMDIFKTSGETMGVKLLKKMGWREGQGIGPKVRRKAVLDDGQDANGDVAETESHLFAPADSPMISFVKKDDSKGLGFGGAQGLEPIRLGSGKTKDDDVQEEDEAAPLFAPKKKSGKKIASKRTGFGVGVLNEDGSDDEDPYQMGPQLSHNRVIGGDKKRRPQGKSDSLRASSNPLLSSKPVFISKKSAATKGGAGFRRCHDGRLPLTGFILSHDVSENGDKSSQSIDYPPPKVPEGWKSSKVPNPTASKADSQDYKSAAEVAAASQLSPKSRAAALGEAQLPGKSVFDFLNPTARDRIATATNKPNLPPALSEGDSRAFASGSKSLASLVPHLDRDVALTALGRGTAGWMPYTEDADKRARYRKFLELRAGIRTDSVLPDRAPGASNDEWRNEMQEFARAAQIFKPMTGTMASRFTSSSSAPQLASDNVKIDSAAGSSDPSDLISRPNGSSKARTAAEEAAAVGMYGPLTRSIETFHPSRLLCKRFNVKPPPHVQMDNDKDKDNGPSGASNGPDAKVSESAKPAHSTALPSKQLELVGKQQMEELRLARPQASQTVEAPQPPMSHPDEAQQKQAVVVEKGEINPEWNEALEKERPGEAVFKAIFGSDSEDD